jgi:hypothetical protein
LGQQQKEQNILHMLDEEGRIILDPKAIIATREKRLRSRIIKEYMIKWKNLLEENIAWESEHFLQLHPSLSFLREQRKI